MTSEPTSSPRIVIARKDQEAAAALILAEAFIEDPVLYELLPGDHQRLHRLAMFILAGIRGDGKSGLVDLAVDEQDTILGAAVWQRPLKNGKAPWSGIVPAAMLIKAAGIAHMRTLDAYGKIFAQHRPRTPHWHLNELGVASAGRNRGVGSALLQHGIDRAATADMPVYLESSTPRNRVLYRRMGFYELGPINGIGESEAAAMWLPAASTPRE